MFLRTVMSFSDLSEAFGDGQHLRARDLRNVMVCSDRSEAVSSPSEARTGPGPVDPGQGDVTSPGAPGPALTTGIGPKWARSARLDLGLGLGGWEGVWAGLGYPSPRPQPASSARVLNPHPQPASSACVNQPSGTEPIFKIG